MFWLGSLARWLANRRRRVFGFHDGSRRRWVDPVRVHSALEEACPDFPTLLQLLLDDPGMVPSGPVRDSLTAGQKDAAKKLVAGIRSAFGVKPLSDVDGSISGLTEPETVRLLMDFLGWLASAAEDAKVFPDSPGPGAASPAAYPTAPFAVSGTTVA